VVEDIGLWCSRLTELDRLKEEGTMKLHPYTRAAHFTVFLGCLALVAPHLAAALVVWRMVGGRIGEVWDIPSGHTPQTR